MTRERDLELALLALYLDQEDMAVSSYETWTYPGGVFNDRVWKEEDAGFPLMKRARGLLGLKAFQHRDREHFGRADERLAEFRAPQHALLKRSRP